MICVDWTRWITIEVVYDVRSSVQNAKCRAKILIDTIIFCFFAWRRYHTQMLIGDFSNSRRQQYKSVRRHIDMWMRGVCDEANHPDTGGIPIGSTSYRDHIVHIIRRLHFARRQHKFKHQNTINDINNDPRPYTQKRTNETELKQCSQRLTHTHTQILTLSKISIHFLISNNKSR